MNKGLKPLFNNSTPPTTKTKNIYLISFYISRKIRFYKGDFNMKLICNKQRLYEALINVSKAAADKSAIPALEGIKFSLSDSTLWLTGYDLEIGIKTSLDVISADKQDIVVNSRLFSEIIKKMPTDEIDIEVNENMVMTIKGGITEYTISVINADEYPGIPDFYTDSRITVPQSVLKEMINQSIFAVSQNDTKPILKGELFEIKDNELNIVAIDGFRLAVRTEAVKSENDFKFVVPSKTLNEVSRLLKDDDDLSCDILVSKKQVVFDFSGYTVFSRLLEGEFHNYRGSIPNTSVTEVVIDKKELISCLERASLLINEKIKSPVRCMFDNGALKLSCQTAIGKIFDEITADISGPKIEIGFNCKYLLDPLKVIPDERIKLLMNGGNLPMKIVPINSSEYTYLVLPVRLKNE